MADERRQSPEDHGGASVTATDPCAPEAFEARYRADGDPWDFAGSSYEQGRYQRVLDALGRDHYRSGYEPACSVGELTVQLASRCDRLRAVDVSATAVARAARRCQHLPGVEVAVASVTDDSPGLHDLVVFSELGYYFDPPMLDEVIDRLAAAVEPDGDLVACHWLGHSVDHRLHGSFVHEQLHRRLPSAGFVHRTNHREPGFVVDAWRRS